MIDTIIQGNAVDVMQGIDSESIDCICTSPPYYGLRSYNTTSQIWGGSTDCEHQWGEIIKQKKRGTAAGTTAQTGYTKAEIEGTEIQQGNFCLLCNAWRGELGSEPTPQLFISHLGTIFGECKRVLKKSGTLWVNLADSYAGGGRNSGNSWELTTDKQRSNKGSFSEPQPIPAGLQAKSLIGIPERFAIMMLDSQWILRNDIIWYKRSVMPESVKDRFTRDFEHIYFFTKSAKYCFEQQFEPNSDAYFKRIEYRQHSKKYEEHPEALANGGSIKKLRGDPNLKMKDVLNIDERGRNMRTVWEIPSEPLKYAHFAHYPQELVRRCVQAGCPEGGVVLDMFMGSGTTGLVAKKMNRRFIGIELNPKYIEIANRRINAVQDKLI